MIITLKNADFSKNNVGTLSTWGITKTLKGVTSNNATTRVDKGASYTATFTVNSGYIYNSSSVTMGGNDITSLLVWDTNYTTATLTISSVTGNVYINISALSDGVGDDDIDVTSRLIGKFYLTHGNPDDDGNSIEDVFVFDDNAIKEALTKDYVTEFTNTDGSASGYMVSQLFDSNNTLLTSNTNSNPLLRGHYVIVDTDDSDYMSTTINGVSVKYGDKLTIGTNGKLTVGSSIENIGEEKGSFYILLGDEYESYNSDVFVFSGEVATAAQSDGLTMSDDGDGNTGYDIDVILNGLNELYTANTNLNKHLKGNYVLVETHSQLNYTSTTINGVTVNDGDKLVFNEIGQMFVLSVG